MFWHNVFNNNSAQIEKLLEKEDVTLKELMEEEELLQECQAQNKKLIDFLTKGNVLHELVNMVVTEPSNDLEYQVRFKHASLASELLSAEVPAIVDKLAASEDLLNTLCKFLSNEKPLNPLLASFFSKVLGMLLHRRAEQNWYQYQVTCFRVLDILKYCPDFIPQITHHIGTSAIMNLLHKLMCGVEEEEIRTRIHAWLRETPLMSLLIAKLGPENEWCEQASTEQLICDLLDSGTCSATNMGININSNCCNSGNNASDNGSQSQLSSTNMLLPLVMNETTVHQLVGILLSENSTSSSTTHVTNVLIKMLLCDAGSRGTAPTALPNSDNTSLEEGSGPSSVSSRSSLSEESTHFSLAQTLADILPQIHNMLIMRSNKELVDTSYGAKVERLGTTRLRLIALIAALIETKHIRIHQTLAKLQTIPLILDLFFQFYQNNFLHTLVQQCVVGLLSQPPPGVVECPRTAPPPQHPADPGPPPVEAMDTSSVPPSTDIPTPVPTTCDPSTILPPEGGGGDGVPEVSSAQSSDSPPEAAATADEDSAPALSTEASASKPDSTFDEKSYALLCQLFREGKLIQRTLATYGYKMSQESIEVPDGSLCGFRGHIRLLSNVILEQMSDGPNKEVITSLVESTPAAVLKDWQQFTSNTLPEANTLNCVNSTLNDDMLQIAEDDLKTSGDVINAMNYSLTFDDNNGFTSGGANASPNKSLTDTISSPLEDKPSSELFEKMCSTNLLQQFQDLSSMWEGKEKCITFSSDGPLDTKSDERCHSSDEEDETEPQHDASMEVDEMQDDWESVFDRRGAGSESQGDNTVEAYNPWTNNSGDSEAPTPPAADSSTGWAAFSFSNIGGAPPTSSSEGQNSFAGNFENQQPFPAFQASDSPSNNFKPFPCSQPSSSSAEAQPLPAFSNTASDCKPFTAFDVESTSPSSDSAKSFAAFQPSFPSESSEGFTEPSAASFSSPNALRSGPQEATNPFLADFSAAPSTQEGSQAKDEKPTDEAEKGTQSTVACEEIASATTAPPEPATDPKPTTKF